MGRDWGYTGGGMHDFLNPPNQDIQSENFGRIVLENPQQIWVLPGSDAEDLEGVTKPSARGEVRL